MWKTKLLSGCTRGLVSLALVGAWPSAAFPGDAAEDPGQEGSGNFEIGPDYKIDPDLTDQGHPQGRSFEFSMRLADSKILPGDDSTLDPKKEVRKERRIFVYVPAAYHSGKKLIENSERKPLRIFTHVSENDLRANDPEETYHNWVMANRRTAAALEAQGYDYRFVFSRASRHCDGKVFEQTLADTLVWMWRGYGE